MAEKDASEGMFSVDGTEKKLQLTKEGRYTYHVMQDVKSNEVAEEKYDSVKGVKLDKKVEQEKDVSEATIPVDDTKKKRKILLIF